MLNEVISHIHPIIVHFPIALITIGVLYDIVVSISKRSIRPMQGIYLWILAALGAMAAVATGPEREAFGVTTLIRTHSNLADLTTWLAVIVVLIRLFVWWRRKEAIKGATLAVYLLLAIVTGGSVLATGYYGGAMVYDQGVGVQVNGKAVNPPKPFHHRNQ